MLLPGFCPRRTTSRTALSWRPAQNCRSPYVEPAKGDRHSWCQTNSRLRQATMVDTVSTTHPRKRWDTRAVVQTWGDPGLWRSRWFRSQTRKSVHDGSDRDEAPNGERRTASPFFRRDAGTTKLSGLSLGGGASRARLSSWNSFSASQGQITQACAPLVSSPTSPRRRCLLQVWRRRRLRGHARTHKHTYYTERIAIGSNVASRRAGVERSSGLAAAVQAAATAVTCSGKLRAWGGNGAC